MWKMCHGSHESFPVLRMNSIELEMRLLDRILLSLFLFGLFREWLAPLLIILGPEESRTIALFYVSTLVLLAMGCVALPWWLFLSVLPLIWITDMLLIFGQYQGLSWLMQYGRIITQDIYEIWKTGRLLDMSGESRMVLLLVGWSFLVLSVQILALSRQSISIFFGATLLYLLALEYGMSLSIYAGLVRTVLIGLLLQAVIHALRFRKESHEKVATAHSFFIIRYMGSVVLILGCILGLAGITRQLDFKAASPLSWNYAVQSLETWTQTSLMPRNQAVYSVSGYGDDDQELGAPIQLKREPFLTMTSPIRTYLRGESKSAYTGRGWEETNTHVALAEDGTISNAHSNSNSLSGSRIRQTITFHKPQTDSFPLWSGGVPIKLERLQDEEKSLPIQSTYYNPSKEAVFYEKKPNDNTHNSQLTGYSITVEARDIPYSQLQVTPLAAQDPASVAKDNLELPKNFPTSVRDLGKRIIKSATTRYDAVMAVQTYLKQHYNYNLKSTVPPAGEDFTAHFLFSSKDGYCTHFSTAMAVLLRTQGIPARWVKGFAPGQASAENKNQYNVSYADAHAWVEVYFPKFGWIPFDPTPGFSITSNVVSNVSSTLIIPHRNYVQNSFDIILHGWVSIAALFSQLRHGKLIGIAMLLLFIIIMILMLAMGWYRARWIKWRLLFMEYGPRRKFPQRTELLEISEKLWILLYAKYGNKPRGITGREYLRSLQLEEEVKRTELIHFLNTWEAVYYGWVSLDRVSTRTFLRKCRHITTNHS